jgi:hypothetical protein
MTNSTNVTKPMIMRIWWARAWRQYLLTAVLVAIIYGMAVEWNLYTEQCHEKSCHYILNGWLCGAFLVLFLAIVIITHWLALNRDFHQVTINGSWFSSRVMVQPGKSKVEKFLSIVKYFFTMAWLSLPIPLAFVALLSMISVLSDLLAILLLFIGWPLFHGICNIPILKFVLSREFNAFEIRITPHAPEHEAYL